LIYILNLVLQIGHVLYAESANRKGNVKSAIA
jgi:hypothetical protein